MLPTNRRCLKFCVAAGSIQVAAAGTALSIASSAQKLLNVPLLAVTTNTVANADAQGTTSIWTCMQAPTHQMSKHQLSCS